MSELTFQDPKKKFCEELREAREYKGLDLSRVSEKSKISLPYLERLESGDWDFLPHAYVRSFLRTYALIVGLEVGKVLEQFDNIVDEPAVPVPGVFETEDGSPQREQRPKKPVRKKRKDEEAEEVRKPLNFTLASETTTHGAGTVSRGYSSRSRSGNNTPWIIGVVVVALIIALIVFWPGGKSSETVQEIPFDEVVSEHEQEAGETARKTPPPARTTTRNDDVPTGGRVEEEKTTPAQSSTTDRIEENRPSSVADSLVTGIVPGEPLVLHAVALQRCYIKVTADQDTAPLSDIVLDPGMRRIYEADSLFTVVLGNAAGMSLRLGDAELGELGEEGRVLTLYIGPNGIERQRRGILRSPTEQPSGLDTINLTRPVGGSRDSIRPNGSDTTSTPVPVPTDTAAGTSDDTTDVMP